MSDTNPKAPEGAIAIPEDLQELLDGSYAISVWHVDGEHEVVHNYSLGMLIDRIAALTQRVEIAESRVKAMTSEQVIWFHGTDEETARIIQQEGFKAGTYFSAHMEDALHFGGLCVFHVRVRWERASLDGWQVISSNHIGPEQIRGLSVFHSSVIYESNLENDAKLDAARAASGASDSAPVGGKE